ncbi:MAG: DUF6089 family protein [Saprospiraceae bacterium]|nr:DUF6089 family protein [Saprospiraceae bacterium]
MKKIIASALFVFYLLSTAEAQKGWEAGAWVGGSYYFGDLNTNFDLSLPGPAGGVIARYNFNERVSLKFSGNYGLMRGDDALSENTFERARNLSFRSHVIELSPVLEFNFLPYVHGSELEWFSPYVFAGFNIAYFNPQAHLNEEWIDLRPLGTEGQMRGEEYASFTGGLVYGLGFKFDLSYDWSVNIELGARQLFTDYLDDVSTTYPDFDQLRDTRGDLAVILSDRSESIPGSVVAPIGAFGRQRGNSTTKDSYVLFGVGLVYYFGSLPCPETSIR